MRDTTETNAVHWPNTQRSSVSRRALLAATTSFAGGAAGMGLLPTPLKAEKRASERSAGSDIITASNSSGIAETTAGKVRGYARNGIHTFKGIPYAQSTAGKGR